jgi:hypothetical protein
MFSIRHTDDPMWKATRKTLALAFNPDAIRYAHLTESVAEYIQRSQERTFSK